MSRTTKACPGCGLVDRGRPADKVCSRCAHALEQWDKHVAAVNAEKVLATVRLKGAYHWYPMFYFGGPHCHLDGLSELRDGLAQDLEELGERCCVESLDWKDFDYEQREAAEYLFLVPEVRLPKKKGERDGERVGYPASDSSPYRDRKSTRLNSRTT